MATYIEQYNKRCKCTNCGDIIWTTDDTQSVYCNCSNSFIKAGVRYNFEETTDTEMIDYILEFRNSNDNDTITLIQV